MRWRDHRRTLGWGVVALATGVGLGRLPLFGDFGYPFAAACAVVLSIASIDLGAAIVRQQARHAAPSGRTVAQATAAALAVALVPLIIGVGRGLMVGVCDWGFGMAAYALLPLVGSAGFAVLGASLALVTGRPTRWWTRALAASAPWLAWLVIAGLGVRGFHGSPAVFTYNPIVGYFPGNLYDERLELHDALGWARLAFVLAALGLVLIALASVDHTRRRVALQPTPWRRGRVRVAVGGALLLWLGGAVFVGGGRLGFRVSPDDVRRYLSATLQTAHFDIHYHPSEAMTALMPLVAEDHEFRYHQVVTALEVAPTGRITSYYFPDQDAKARWIGARDVEMAKPWRREIYLDHRAFPHASLRHEIAHVVAGEFGDPWFAVSSRRVLGLPLLGNPGMIEGLAVAVDWPAGYDRELSPHQAVRTMQAMGVEPSVDDLFSLRFLSVAAARGYATAGSFLRFLLDRYGAAPVRVLYQTGGDFDRAFGRDQAALATEWRQFIADLPFDEAVVARNRERFRRGSVFERRCPHAIARHRRDAYAAARAGDRAGTLAALRAVCALDGEPSSRGELASVLEDGSEADRAEAHALWSWLATDEGFTPSVRGDAWQQLARRAAVAGDWDRAASLLRLAAALPLDEGDARVVDAGQRVLAHPGPAASLLRDYLFGVDRDLAVQRPRLADARRLEPTVGLIAYFDGLAAANADDLAAAARALDDALRLGLPDVRYRRNAARRLAQVAYRARDDAGLTRALDTLRAPDMRDVDRMLADDWAARRVFAGW